MDISELATKFDGYHSDVKSLAKRMDDHIKHAEDLEARMNRALLGGGRSAPDEAAELRAAGEAMRKYIRNGDESGISELLEQRGLSVGSDPGGGYSVIPTFSSAITKKVFELSPMRRLARVMPIESDSFEELLDLEEAEATWVGETTSRTETTAPTFGKLIIPAHEIYAAPAVTQKLLDDSSIDIGAWLVDKIGQRFARKEGAAFASGDGVAKPRGILSHTWSTADDSTRAWGAIQYVATGTSGGFGTTTNGTDKLLDVSYALKAEYRANARWLMNRKTAGAVRKIKDGQGNYAWTESTVLGQPSTLLGHPVELCEDLPDIGADSYSIAFGDWGSAYTIVDRLGERLLRDPFSNKPSTIFYTYKRVGGAVSNFEALKFLKFGTS